MLETANEYESSRAHHAVHGFRRFPAGGRKGPHLAGFCTTRRSLRPPTRGASGDLALLSLALEIRLPGNRRPPSAETRFEWRKSQHLALARPFGGQVGEADNSHAVREPSFDRSPDEVFAYVTDPARFTEWQNTVVSAHTEDSDPVHVGSRFVMTRKMGSREQTMTSEITEHQPPRRYAFRVIDGPVRAYGKGRFEPLDDGARTRFTFELDFEGHGIGKVLVPLVVRRQASRELPQSHANLKQRLEATQT